MSGPNGYPSAQQYAPRALAQARLQQLQQQQQQPRQAGPSRMRLDGLLQDQQRPDESRQPRYPPFQAVGDVGGPEHPHAYGLGPRNDQQPESAESVQAYPRPTKAAVYNGEAVAGPSREAMQRSFDVSPTPVLLALGGGARNSSASPLMHTPPFPLALNGQGSQHALASTEAGGPTPSLHQASMPRFVALPQRTRNKGLLDATLEKQQRRSNTTQDVDPTGPAAQAPSRSPNEEVDSSNSRNKRRQQTRRVSAAGPRRKESQVSQPQPWTETGSSTSTRFAPSLQNRDASTAQLAPLLGSTLGMSNGSLVQGAQQPATLLTQSGTADPSHPLTSGLLAGSAGNSTIGEQRQAAESQLSLWGFRYLSDGGVDVLICKACRCAVKNIRAHMRHHVLQGQLDTRREVEATELLRTTIRLGFPEHQELAERAEIPVPDPRISPIDDLETGHGFGCTAHECRYVAFKAQEVVAHMQDAHPDLPYSDPLYQPRYAVLQLWNDAQRPFEVARGLLWYDPALVRWPADFEDDDDDVLWAPPQADTRTTEQRAHALLRRHGFAVLPVHRAIVCIVCKIAIRGHEDGLFSHFRTVHSHLGQAAARLRAQEVHAIIDRYFPDTVEPDSLERPDPTSPALPYLNIFTHGYSCNACDFTAAQHSAMAVHLKRRHPLDPTISMRKCKEFQAWTKDGRGYRSYFQVNATPRELGRPAPAPTRNTIPPAAPDVAESVPTPLDVELPNHVAAPPVSVLIVNAPPPMFPNTAAARARNQYRPVSSSTAALAPYRTIPPLRQVTTAPTPVGVGQKRNHATAVEEDDALSTPSSIGKRLATLRGMQTSVLGETLWQTESSGASDFAPLRTDQRATPSAPAILPSDWTRAYSVIRLGPSRETHVLEVSSGPSRSRTASTVDDSASKGLDRVPESFSSPNGTQVVDVDVDEVEVV